MTRTLSGCKMVEVIKRILKIKTKTGTNKNALLMDNAEAAKITSIFERIE